jgi:hypothetical protein
MYTDHHEEARLNVARSSPPEVRTVLIWYRMKYIWTKIGWINAISEEHRVGNFIGKSRQDKIYQRRKTREHVTVN